MEDFYGRLIKRRKKSNDEEVEGSTGKKYILSKAQVKKYFAFLENVLEQQPCDHTLRYTQYWGYRIIKVGRVIENSAHFDYPIITTT